MAVPSAPTFIIEPATVYYDLESDFEVRVGGTDGVINVVGSIMDASTVQSVSSLQFTRTGAYRWSVAFTPSSVGLSVGGNYYVSVYAENNDGYSPAATSTVFSVESRASVAIISPADGSTIDAFPVTLSWEYLYGGWPSSVQVDVSANGVTQYAYPDPAETTLTFDSLDVSDGDRATFVVTARFTDGGATTTSVSVSMVSFDFPNVPGAPTAGISYGDDLSASITVHYGTDTVAAAVIRYIDDGEDQWVVASNVADGATVTDPLPPLGVDFAYAVVSYSADGVPLYTMFPARIDTTQWAFNCGQQAYWAMTYRFNPQQSRTVSHGGDMYHFADGGMGRGLPVFYETTDRDMSGTIRFDTDNRWDAERIVDLSSHFPLMWIRDPYGNRWYAHVVFTITHGIGKVWDVQASWDAVRWTEAWNG